MDLIYKLRLPKGSKIHPIFYISLLEPAPNKEQLDDSILELEEHKLDKYNVERILDSRISTKKKELEYLVKWLD